MKGRSIYQGVFSRLLPVLCVSGFLVGCGAPPQPGPPIVTKEEVNQIKVGMTLEEVQKVVGDPGKPTSPAGDSPLTAHVWMNDDGSVLTVSFMNGRVQQKSTANFK